MALCASVLVAPLLLHRPGGARVAHSASRPARVTAGRDSHAASSAASRSDAVPMTADQLAALESAAAGAGTVSAQAASRAVPTADVASTDTLASTTTTVAVAPARPEVRAATTTTTTTEAPTTTTTEPRTTTTTTRPSTTTTSRSSSNSETGSASWYQAPAGTCAHPSLPFGTVVTVTNLANGATTKCRVEDRGPYAGGRIIDLSESTFSQIASTSQGVIQVRIEW